MGAASRVRVAALRSHRQGSQTGVKAGATSRASVVFVVVPAKLPSPVVLGLPSMVMTMASSSLASSPPVPPPRAVMGTSEQGSDDNDVGEGSTHKNMHPAMKWHEPPPHDHDHEAAVCSRGAQRLNRTRAVTREHRTGQGRHSPPPPRPWCEGETQHLRLDVVVGVVPIRGAAGSPLTPSHHGLTMDSPWTHTMDSGGR